MKIVCHVPEVAPATPAPHVPEASPAVPDAADQSSPVEADTDAGTVTESVARVLPEPPDAAKDDPAVPPFAADTHARLAERMVRLAQERNAVRRRILATFTRTP